MQDTKVNKRITNSVGLIVLTFLGIAIETLFFLSIISSVRQIFLVQGQAELFIPTDLLLLIGFILVPVIYCSFASIALHPKTMVNPILVQAGTIALVIVLTVINLLSSQFILSAQFAGVLSFMLILSALFIALIGIFQWLAVNWVIRMNFEDSDRVSYLIPMKPKEILHKLGTSFLDDWTFSRECDIEGIYVLERNDDDRCLLLEIGAESENDNVSVLATVAYAIEGNWIVRSSSASNLREIIVGDIEKRLHIKFSEDIADLNHPVSRLANDNVKDLARSRIEVTWMFLRKLPRTYKLMIGLTLALLAGISIAYFNYPQWNINSDTYVGAIVILIIALFVEIGLPLRDEIQKRKREEIEF